MDPRGDKGKRILDPQEKRLVDRMDPRGDKGKRILDPQEKRLVDRMDPRGDKFNAVEEMLTEIDGPDPSDGRVGGGRDAADDIPRYRCKKATEYISPGFKLTVPSHYPAYEHRQWLMKCKGWLFPVRGI